jgi:hypothetical protein
VGKPEGKRPLGRPRNECEMILKWILEKYEEVVWTGFIGHRIESSGVSCEYGNEPSGSIICWEFPG